MSNFPTKQNPILCKFDCGTKIYLSKKEGNKYSPYNLDDSPHNCQNKLTPDLGEVKTNQQNHEAKLAHIIESIQQVLKELESLK